MELFVSIFLGTVLLFTVAGLIVLSLLIAAGMHDNARIKKMREKSLEEERERWGMSQKRDR